MRLSILFLLSLSTFFAQSSQIALIIDDMGNNSQDAAAFLLPQNVTFAILPNKPLSRVFSERASKQHRDVILHMPMESLSGDKQEQNVLLSTMSSAQIESVLKTALNSVPHAIGLNNHMGSKFTQLTFPLSVTMDFLLKNQLFFVDSRTTRYSKAQQIADKKGVQNIRRHVFLDHVAKVEQIEIQFHQLMKLSKKYDYVVAIAHPYPDTVSYLKKHLYLLEEQGITLTKISDLISSQSSSGLSPHYITSIPTLKD